MLLRDDVVADRQTKTGSLARRLRGEERLEQLGAHLGCNAGAVVAHPDLHGLTKVARRDLERRLVAVLPILPLALAGSVKPVTE